MLTTFGNRVQSLVHTVTTLGAQYYTLIHMSAQRPLHSYIAGVSLHSDKPLQQAMMGKSS